MEALKYLEKKDSKNIFKKDSDFVMYIQKSINDLLLKLVND